MSTTTSTLNWHKSSYSSSASGDCIEVADCPGAVRVRDSKDKSGPQLAFGVDAWVEFVEFAKQH